MQTNINLYMFQPQVLVKKTLFRPPLGFWFFPAKVWAGVTEAWKNALICALIFYVTEVCIRYPMPMWQTVVIDTFFAFWSFLVVQQNFNFRFQCPCYKPGAHAQYTIRWSMLRLGSRASLGPAIIIVLKKLKLLPLNLLVILMRFLLSVQDAAVILEQCCPVQTSPCGLLWCPWNR